MRTRRTATAAATALATIATSGLLLTSAGTASAQDRGTASVPGMEARHQQVNGSGRGMARRHELHAEQNPGMVRMHHLMTDGPR